MNSETEKRFLQNVDQILKKIQHFFPLVRERAGQLRVQTLLNDVTLLKDDLVLFFTNQQYLRAQLDHLETKVQAVELQLEQKQIQHSQEIETIKMKYFTQIEKIRYSNFVKGSQGTILLGHEDPPMSSLQCARVSHQSESAAQLEQKEGPRNAKTVKKVCFSSNQSPGFQFQEKPENTPFLANIEQIQPIFKTEDVFLSRSKQSGKRLHGSKRGSSEVGRREYVRYQKVETRRGVNEIAKNEGFSQKRAELARLVQLQQKAPVFREHYFSTDLQ